MSESTSALTTIPAGLKSQLPIFQVLGDKLPAPMKTPEGKKIISNIFFGHWYWVVHFGFSRTWIPCWLMRKKVFCLLCTALY